MTVRQMALRLLMGVALVALTAAPAAAQRMELGGGVSFQEWNSDFAESKGFGIDFAHRIKTLGDHQISVIGDFARHRFSGEETDTSVMAGARLKLWRARRVAVFVQGLVGVMMWSEDDGGSGNDRMIGGGGGVQITLTDRIDAKAQMDFFRANSDPVKRLLFGVVVRLGGD